MKYLNSLLFLLSITLIGCLERFDPTLSNTPLGDDLVVEAVIKQEDFSFRIKLSNSVPRGSNRVSTPINDAKASLISEDLDASFNFSLIESGIYSLNQNQVELKTGSRYKLRIILANGERYESTFEEVLPAQPVQELQLELARGSYQLNNNIVEGEYIEISSLIQKGEENHYFRFDYEGDYAFRAPYQGSDLCQPVEVEGGPEILPSLLCYKKDDQTLPVNIHSNENFKVGGAASIVVLRIGSNRKFAFGYNMRVRKYTISKEFYDYLESVKAQVDFEGSLLDPPPSQIIGNISNVDDPEKKALGYFTIESVSSETIFIPADFFQEPIEDPLNEYACNYSPETPNVLPDLWCCDCRLFPGATVEPPLNWPEK